MATLTDHSRLKFCPFCGGKLDEFDHAISFCPLCGERLSVGEKQVQAQEQPQPQLQPQPVQVVAVGKEVELGDKNTDSTRQEFFDRLKHKLGAGGMASTQGIAANILRPRYVYYNVVLKDCIDKEALSHRLEKVLLRSYTAIRLAVERTPCIVVYKGKIEEMAHVTDVFREEKAAVSVVIGDIDTNFSLEQLFPGLQEYPAKDREILEGVPKNLWLGESIQYMLFDTYLERMGEENSGTLVVTAQSLYFVYKDEATANYRWIVMPYIQIGQVSIGAGLYYDGLAITYKDERDAELFVVTDEQRLTEIYEAVGRAIDKAKPTIF